LNKFNRINNRRSFLKACLGSAVGLSNTGAMLSNMALMKSALAQSSNRFDDYKALVCIFLHGGNDSFNMLVPTANSEYTTYQSVRQQLAFNQADLLSISPSSNMPYQLGIPNAMTPLQSLFQQGDLAFLANAGPLLQPITKSQALQNDSLLPPQLFSHNDQQKLWQTAWSEQTSPTGWAGRMADLIMDSSNPLSMNLSIDGSNIFQTGINSLPYSLDAAGVESFELLNPNQQWNEQRIITFDKLLNANRHILGQAHTDIYQRAQSNIGILSNAIENANASTVNYPNNHFAKQLKMVATLASQQQLLAQPRQIFFVGLGGFDTHDNQAVKHPQLLLKLSEALAIFSADLKTKALFNSVTAFTISDFGRTLTSNGDGTDHGWGGHQIMMGGAVKGGDIYGTLPQSLVLDSDDDLGDGRMIPTTSVDQYAATLAKWFGLSTNEINAVFPNLTRFELHDLAFMR